MKTGIFSLVVLIVLLVDNKSVGGDETTQRAMRRGGGRFGLGRVRSFIGRQISEGFLSSTPKEAFMTTPELIRLAGYPVEEHQVQTEDGYIITVFRIPHGRNSGFSRNNNGTGSGTEKEPVLIIHGFMCSSDDWLIHSSPKDVLPYLLADAGHDVWLANYRGNSYGLNHANGVKAKDAKFYDFGMDEIGLLDMPAIIRYVLNLSRASQLSAVCHSMGCNVIGMALHDMPELQTSIKKMSFLAPGFYVTHIQTPMFKSLRTVPNAALQSFSTRYAGGRLIAKELNTYVKRYGPHVCNREQSKQMCSQFISTYVGINPNHTDYSDMVKSIGHIPSDTSAKVFVQYRQISKSDNFQKFDYGKAKNEELYKSAKPPKYDLSKIRVPVQGFYTLLDLNIAVPDALRAFKELGNVEEVHQLQDLWHLDFMYGNAAREVYEKVVKYLS